MHAYTHIRLYIHVYLCTYIRVSICDVNNAHMHSDYTCWCMCVIVHTCPAGVAVRCSWETLLRLELELELLLCAGALEGVGLSLWR